MELTLSAGADELVNDVEMTEMVACNSEKSGHHLTDAERQEFNAIEEYGGSRKPELHAFPATGLHGLSLGR